MSVIYLWHKFIKYKKTVKRHNREGSPYEMQKIHKDYGSAVIILDIISDPYRQDLFGRLCWESVIALRRLILVVVSAMAVARLLAKQLALSLVCFVSIVTHVQFKPLTMRIGNQVETISLSTLLIISLMNVLKAAYFELGKLPEGYVDDLFRIWYFVEMVLLGVVQLAIVGFVILALIIRLIAVPIEWRKSRNKAQRDSHTQVNSGFEGDAPASGLNTSYNNLSKAKAFHSGSTQEGESIRANGMPGTRTIIYLKIHRKRKEG